jgi:beta-lactamase superfamily II metal-dependent hydrolase
MAKTPARTIRVRMYRVGFGDCFLVTLPGPHHIVVDCGVHALGDIHTIEKAVDDIVAETAGHVALLIATHAHQDHISGFGAFEEQFRTLTIDEVWLPWTENPKDAQALKLRKKQLTLVKGLMEHLRLTGAADGAAMSALTNIAGNERALQNLRQGFGSAMVRFVEQGQTFDNVGNVKDLQAKVLGPPRGTEFLARMDPPAGQRFLRLVNGHRQESAVRPFQQRWVTTRAAGTLSVKEQAYLREVVASPADELAFALDSALNNTSVVTLLSYAGRQLLFPGDAQYGNWQSWLQDQAAAAEILGSIDFYKVAHHGSFNATPKEALQQMASGKFAAMVSTQNAPWPSIPLPNLVTAVEKQTGGRLVRSDSLAIAGAPKGPALSRLPARFAKGPFWYDYNLAV